MNANSPTALNRYRVKAFYERVPVERSAEVCAESAARAMVVALLERLIPAGFAPDAGGWLAPVWWSPELAGEGRWPRIAGPGRLVWGPAERPQELRLEVELVQRV